MDSVSHMADGDFVLRPARKQRKEETPAHFSMQAAHPVHRPAPADRQICHVERLRRVERVLAAKGQQVVKSDAELLLGIPAEVLLDQRGRKTVKTGGHRRVGGEQIARSRDRQGDFERLPCVVHERAGAFQHGERRVSFIQVTDLRREAQRAQQPPAADPEQHFLLEPQFRPAPIQLAGYSPMNGEVRRVIAVQQVQLHPADLGLPGAQPDRVSRQCDLQPQPLAVWLAQRRDRQLSRIVIRVEGLLLSVFVDHLAKIALLVEQPHGGHRHTQIAGGLELIAGHITQPARVNGQSFAQHEFHAEIRSTGQWSCRISPLKPRGRFRRLPAVFDQIVYVFPESGIGQHPLDPVPRGRLQDHPGVMRDLPQFRIKLPPHIVGSMIPRPMHVQGELRQGIDSFGFRRQEMVCRVADTGLFAHDFGALSSCGGANGMRLGFDRLQQIVPGFDEVLGALKLELPGQLPGVDAGAGETLQHRFAVPAIGG